MEGDGLTEGKASGDRGKRIEGKMTGGKGQAGVKRGKGVDRGKGIERDRRGGIDGLKDRQNVTRNQKLKEKHFVKNNDITKSKDTISINFDRPIQNVCIFRISQNTNLLTYLFLFEIDNTTVKW